MDIAYPSGLLRFEDQVLFKRPDLGGAASAGGDSGSGIVTERNGIWYDGAQLFAGSEVVTIGNKCRHLVSAGALPRLLNGPRYGTAPEVDPDTGEIFYRGSLAEIYVNVVDRTEVRSTVMTLMGPPEEVGVGQEHDVLGRLVDDTGEPVVGGEISLKGFDTDGPLLTDDHGAFSVRMSHAEPGSHLIVATYAGTAPG